MNDDDDDSCGDAADAVGHRGLGREARHRDEDHQGHHRDEGHQHRHQDEDVHHHQPDEAQPCGHPYREEAELAYRTTIAAEAEEGSAYRREMWGPRQDPGVAAPRAVRPWLQQAWPQPCRRSRELWSEREQQAAQRPAVLVPRPAPERGQDQRFQKT